MHTMYELFAPNLLTNASVKKYKMGDIFLLQNSTAIVMEGVVAVDSLSLTGEPVTLWLATENDILNVDSVIDPPSDVRQFVCESPIVVIAEVPITHFKDSLNSKSIELQNAISQSLLRELHKQNQAMADTIANISAGTATEKVLWAVKRYQTVTKCTGDLPLRKERIAVHIASRPETVSRVLTKLHDDGVLRRSRPVIRLEASE